MADTPEGKPRGTVWVDPATRAAHGLDAALREKVPEATAEEGVPEPAPQVRSDRQAIRVLLFTTDTDFFAAGSATQREWLALAPYLDELHVIVLCDRMTDAPPSVRLGERVWVYATLSRSRFSSVRHAYRIAKKELTLSAGFRADLVVADDAYEAGFAAYRVARAFERPLQLSLSSDPLAAGAEAGFWRRWAARFVLRRTACVLVRAGRIRDALVRHVRRLHDRVTVLPPFYDLAFFRDAQPQFDLRAQYPQFKFMVLVASSLEAHDRVDLALDVCAPLLAQYPTIGLVIVGGGTERAALMKSVEERGLYEQVLFAPETHDLVSYMKAANLFLSVTADEAHDAMLTVAAASGLPILTVASPAAEKLFKDGADAFVCPAEDPVCLTARIGEFLNDNSLRKSFAINAREQVFSLAHEDPAAYRDRFVGLLESCLLRDSDAI